MSYIDDHVLRWAPHFGREPWWEMHRALYEGPGHDWEGADDAMELMVYQLAKARGIDTTQVCPRCKATVDEHRTFGRWHWCRPCREQEEWEHQAEVIAKMERKVAERVRRAALTTGERNREDAEGVRNIRLMMDGLIGRDVQ